MTKTMTPPTSSSSSTTSEMSRQQRSISAAMPSRLLMITAMAMMAAHGSLCSLHVAEAMAIQRHNPARSSSMQPSAPPLASSVPKVAQKQKQKRISSSTPHTSNSQLQMAPTAALEAQELTTKAKRVVRSATFVLQRSQNEKGSPIDMSDPTILHNAGCVHPQFFHSPASGSRNQLFSMTNVLGDGDCVFRTIRLGLEKQNENDPSAQRTPQEWRHLIAKVLARSPPSSTLFVSGKQIATTRKLLQSAALAEFGSNDLEAINNYLIQLQTAGAAGGLYAGGPELTVLANLLQCPIHIYECESSLPTGTAPSIRPTVQFKLLDDAAGSANNSNDDQPQQSTTSCQIQRVGTFGDRFGSSPNFGSKIPSWAIDASIATESKQREALHILMLDMSSNEKHACLLTPMAM